MTKMTGFRRFFVVILVLAVSITAASARADRTLVVAANLPLTGELAMYGAAIRDGAILAAEQLVVPPGGATPLSFDWQNNEGNNAATNSVLKLQLARNPDIYVSGLKPQTMVIADELTRRRVPHFTWILDTEINPSSDNNLRIWISFKAEAEAFLAYLKQRKVERVAMFYAELPAAKVQYNEILVPELRRRGTKEFAVDSYPLNTSDFRTHALKIKKFAPDIIILNGFANHVISFVRALREYRLVGDGNTLVSLDMLEAAPQMKPAEIEHIVVAAPPFLCGNPSEAYRDWEERFRKRFGEAPLYHSAYAYDMVRFIGEAKKALPPGWSPSQLLKALRTAHIEGITGPISLNADGSLASEMLPALYENGRLQAVTGK